MKYISLLFSLRIGLVLALCLATLASSVLAQQQHPFNAPASASISPSYAISSDDRDGNAPTSPLDALTASSEHTTFVRLLQRARLVPLLIRLIEYGDERGLTILAPTNEAFQRESGSGEHGAATSFWEKALSGEGEVDVDAQDNVASELRQRLLYHILNYTLPYDVVANLSESSGGDHQPKLASTMPLPIARPDMHTTLHRPSRSQLEEPTHPGPIPQPPDGPGHPGAEDRGGLLGGEGQKVRAIWKWQGDDGDKEARDKPRPGSLWFHVDARGKGGFPSLRSISTKRGLVVVLNGTLALPPSLTDIVRTHPALKTLKGIIDSQLLHTLAHTAHATLFLPASPSFEALPSLQQSYLLRNTSLEEQRDDAWKIVGWDRTKVLGWHVTGRGLRGDDGQWGIVGHAERLRAALDENDGTLSLTTILGGPLHLRLGKSDSLKDDDSDPRDIVVSENARIIEEDILCENGVVHIVDSLLLPQPEALSLNVEKTLLALNASRFVGMMRKAGLEEEYLLVGGSESQGDDDDDNEPNRKPRRRPQWTIIAPTDESLQRWLQAHPDAAQLWRRFEDGHVRTLDDDDDSDDEAESKLVNLLRYHVIPGIVQPQNLTDGGLVATELRSWRLKEGRQRIVTSLSSSSPGKMLKDPPKADSSITFGDASVIADPVIVTGPPNRKENDSDSAPPPPPAALIYLTSSLLTPPDNPIQTAVSASLSLSTFIAAVFSSELDKAIKRAPGVTYLVPNNEAFSNLGAMVMKYLLLNAKESREGLTQLVEYHAIDQVVYVGDVQEGWKRYPTLEGSEILVGRTTSEGWKSVIEVRRDDGRKAGRNESALPNGAAFRPPIRNARVKAKDLLTDTGVLHEIDTVEMPPDLDLTSDKLLRGAKCDTFRDLVVRAGYGFVLNGTQPPDEDGDEEDASSSLLSSLFMRKTPRQRHGKKHSRRHRLFRDPARSYVLLAPTEEAFSRVNLTRYTSDPQKLKELVQLHIVPSPDAEDEANWRAAEEQSGPAGEDDEAAVTRWALPLGLRDGWELPSLLDRATGGTSRYGRIAFRYVGATKASPTGGGGDDDDEDGDDDDESHPLGWQLGIRGSRGAAATRSAAGKHSARIVDFGRESRRLFDRDEDDDDDDTASSPLKKRKGKKRKDGDNDEEGAPLRALGGVLLINSVLLPYEPTWFHRWGWILLTVALCLAGAALLAVGAWRSWVTRTGGKGRRRKGSGVRGEGEEGEAMEGEEE